MLRASTATLAGAASGLPARPIQVVVICAVLSPASIEIAVGRAKANERR